MTKSRITIIGAGNMGTALATAIAANRHPVTCWSIEPDVVEDIVRNHRTAKYLPGVALDPRITATGDLAAALGHTGGVVVAVPSHVIAKVLPAVAAALAARVPVLSAAKGIEPATFRPLPDMIATGIGRPKGGVAGLAGPAVATELAAGTPTAVVVAGRPTDTAFWAHVLARPTFRVYASRELLGVSWCAALKNVYAIALGMCDGMRYAMNTKAVLMTDAIDEMSMFLRSVRARPTIAYGIAGLGDLVTTGFSPHGRNRKFGEMVCAGGDCDIPAMLKTMTVEGVAAVDVAHAWARGQGLSFPLLELVWRVCHHRANPCRSLLQYLRHS